VRTAWWVGLVASVCLLTGCSATTLPAGPDTAELEAFTARELDQAWRMLERSDARPAVERVRYISNDEYGAVMEDCFDDGPADGQLAWFICQSKFPVTPDEYRVLSPQQMRYLYDYYARWSIPCLAERGFVVELPEYNTFVDRDGLYNLLYGDQSAPAVDEAEYRSLADACGLEASKLFPK